MKALNNAEWDVCVGIDWADQFHDYHTQDDKFGRFPSTPEGIDRFVRELTDRFPGKRLGICLEQSRGSLIYALRNYPQLVLFPINPSQLAHFRKALQPSGKSDDRSDAWLLTMFLQYHGGRLRAWVPEESELRQLNAYVEQRRHFVDQRTHHMQELEAALKKYFPLGLTIADRLDSEMAADFLTKWPSLRDVQRQKPEYIAKFFRRHNCRSQERIDERLLAIQQARHVTEDPGIIEPLKMLVKYLVQLIRHTKKIVQEYDDKIAKLVAVREDASLFSSIRGVGPQLTPRLLVAFGTDRQRFRSAAEVQSYAGIAPVTKKSGKKNIVHRRLAAPNFLRQTFHELAEQMRKYSQWSKAYYDMQRKRGKSHHVAVRALAFKWIRILFAVWKERKPYDENQYIQQLKKRKSEVIDYLPKITATP